MAWGPGVDPTKLAHGDDKMACYTCHLSWTTSCAGCHLPIQANWKTERHHYEGGETRNFATYNPQVARDEMFQLGKHGPVKGGKIAPVRSSSALVLSSTNINRERIYIQQPPIAASGFSSQAFAPHYPHTERKTETKTCTDCHLSQNERQQRDHGAAAAAGDQLRQLRRLQRLGRRGEARRGRAGHRVGRAAGGDRQLPAQVRLSRLVRRSTRSATCGCRSRVRTTRAAPARCLQLRGEYLYVAEGRGRLPRLRRRQHRQQGLLAEDHHRAVLAARARTPHVASTNATCVALPTNQPIASRCATRAT